MVTQFSKYGATGNWRGYVCAECDKLLPFGQPAECFGCGSPLFWGIV